MDVEETPSAAAISVTSAMYDSDDEGCSSYADDDNANAPPGEPLVSNVAGYLNRELYDWGLTDHLRRIFGFEEFRDNQLEVCKNTLLGKDSLVVMATGSGKSIMYQLPAVALRGLGLACTTIVVSPLLSLIEDQVLGLRAKGIAAGRITGSSSRQEEDAARKGDYVLLYTTPEKIVMWKDGLKELMLHASIVCIAVDEAHWYIIYHNPDIRHF